MADWFDALSLVLGYATAFAIVVALPIVAFFMAPKDERARGWIVILIYLCLILGLMLVSR